MNPPLRLTQNILHPHSLRLEGGFASWQLQDSNLPFTGPRVSASLGGDFVLTPHLNLRVSSLFQNSFLSRGVERLNVTGFKLEAGPNIALFNRWLNLGLYGGAGVDVYYSENGITPAARGNRQRLDNLGAATLSIRPELCIAGQSICLSYEYARSLGLNLAAGTSTTSYYPATHFIGGALDFLKISSLLRERTPYIEGSLRRFVANSELTLHTLAGVTWAPLGGAAPHPYRTIEGESLIPRLNNIQLLFRRKAVNAGDIGLTLGLNIGQDFFVNPTFSVNTPLLDGLFNFAVLPAYVSYAFNKQLSLDAGIFTTTIGPEDPQHQNRNPLTTSLGFNFQPFYITGAKLNLTVDDNHFFYAGITNRTDTAFDHQAGLTGIAGYTLTQGANILSINTLLGEEALGPRAILDIIWTHNINPQTAVMMNADLGTRAIAGEGNLIYGFVNALVTHQWDNNRWRVYGRAEALGDQGTAGTQQVLLTATAGIRRDFLHTLNNGTVGLALDARVDCSVWRPEGVASPFANGNSCNPTVGLNMLWSLPIHPPQ